MNNPNVENSYRMFQEDLKYGVYRCAAEYLEKSPQVGRVKTSKLYCTRTSDLGMDATGEGVGHGVTGV